MSDLNESQDLPASNTSKLESLGGMTQDFEKDNPSPEQAQKRQQAEQITVLSDQGAREWGIMLFSIGGMITMIAPELKPVYSEERCFQWGQHMQNVCQKHGWSSPKSSPEFGLLMASVTFLLPTISVLPSKIKEAKAKQNSMLGRVVMWWHKKRGTKAEPVKSAEDGNTAQQ